jgi:hypothetical protein
MKKRLVAAVERLSRKALHQRNYVPDVGEKPWIYHAIAAHEDRPFKAILTNCYSGNEKFIISCEKDFINDSKWTIPLDLEVRRNDKEMILSIKPMLDCAREVVLIDRNFHPKKYRWRMFLTKLAKFLYDRTFSPSIRKIDFHIGDAISVNELQRLSEKYIKPIAPAGIKLNFYIWDRGKLHDRYVLTDIGGVRFGIGLDIWDGSGPKEVEISRVSEETRRRWWALCKNKTVTFTIS